MKALPPSLILLLFLCQCAKDDTEEAPVVGVVKTTTHEFTLHAGPKGTLYTVRDGSRRVIAREVSASELAATHPKLSEDLKSLYAGNEILRSPIGEPNPVMDRPGEEPGAAREVELQLDGLPTIPDP